MLQIIGDALRVKNLVSDVKYNTRDFYQYINGKEKTAKGFYWCYQSKKEGKDKESIQSSTTPDPGYQ